MTNKEFWEELAKIREESKGDYRLRVLSDSYLRFLYDRITSLFKYNHSIEGFDEFALETIAMTEGRCGIFDIQEKGLYAIPLSYQYGVDTYTNLPLYRRFEETGYANAYLGSRQGYVINEDMVMLYNTPSEFTMYPLLTEAAITLAHIDISLRSLLINGRMTGVFIAENQVQIRTVEEMYKKLEYGVNGIITGDNILQTLKYIPTEVSHGNSIENVISARNNQLRYILRLCGFTMDKDKSQAILSNEAEDEDRLLVNILEVMLSQRKKMCENIYRVFEKEITVTCPYLDRLLVNQKNNEEQEEQEEGVINDD